MDFDGQRVDCKVLVSRDALRALLEWQNDSCRLIERLQQLKDEGYGEDGSVIPAPSADVTAAFELLSQQIWSEVTTFACRHARHYDELWCQLCGKSFQWQGRGREEEVSKGKPPDSQAVARVVQRRDRRKRRD